MPDGQVHHAHMTHTYCMRNKPTRAGLYAIRGYEYTCQLQLTNYRIAKKLPKQKNSNFEFCMVRYKSIGWKVANGANNVDTTLSSRACSPMNSRWEGGRNGRYKSCHSDGSGAWKKEQKKNAQQTIRINILALAHIHNSLPFLYFFSFFDFRYIFPELSVHFSMTQVS